MENRKIYSEQIIGTVGWEIERKFLVIGDAWRMLAGGHLCRQGYLSIAKERTVRVRTYRGQGAITVKGLSRGPRRREYEYPIPLADAEAMLDHLCRRPLIEKNRHRIVCRKLLWEVDEFFGSNEGLIVAEVELADPFQHVSKPDWIGQEVTHDPRYFNANLVFNPYQSWPG